MIRENRPKKDGGCWSFASVTLDIATQETILHYGELLAHSSRSPLVEKFKGFPLGPGLQLSTTEIYYVVCWRRDAVMSAGWLRKVALTPTSKHIISATLSVLVYQNSPLSHSFTNKTTRVSSA